MRVLWIAAAVGAIAVISAVTYRATAPREPLFTREGEHPPITPEQIDQRISELEPEVAVAPHAANLRVDLGILYYLKGPLFYDRAIAMLDSAWRLGAADVRIFYYLGVMYDFIKLPAFAAAEYRRFLVNRPGDHEVVVRLARVYYLMERYDEAASLYYEILDRERDNRIALGNLGIVNLARGRETEAQENFVRAIAVSTAKGLPPPPGVCYGLGIIYERSGSTETAREYLQREVAAYPENIVLPNVALARIAWRQGDVLEARRLCTVVLDADPSNREARELLRDMDRRRK